MTATNVALVGALQSGKDSVAAYLIAEKGYTRFSFADALKVEVANVLNGQSHPPAYVPGGGNIWTRNLVEEHKEFLRPLLQWYGTEYRRAQDPEYWVRQTLSNIEDWQTRHDGPIVFTDARFTNELEAARSLGCKIVYLDMSYQEVRERMAAKGMLEAEISLKLAHPSENEWRNFHHDARFDSVVGNLPELASRVLDFLSGTPATIAATRPEVDFAAVEFFAKLYPDAYGWQAGLVYGPR